MSRRERESRCPGCFFQMLVPYEAGSIERAGPPPGPGSPGDTLTVGHSCLEGVIAETASWIRGFS